MCAIYPYYPVAHDVIIPILFAKGTSFEAFHNAVLSNLLLFHPLSVQMFSTAPCSSYNVRDQVSHPYKTTGKL
jgi:hypothetical protein